MDEIVFAFARNFGERIVKNGMKSIAICRSPKVPHHTQIRRENEINEGIERQQKSQIEICLSSDRAAAYREASFASASAVATFVCFDNCKDHFVASKEPKKRKQEKLC